MKHRRNTRRQRARRWSLLGPGYWKLRGAGWYVRALGDGQWFVGSFRTVVHRDIKAVANGTAFTVEFCPVALAVSRADAMQTADMLDRAFKRTRQKPVEFAIAA